MSCDLQIKEYFAAWNAHDAVRVAAMFSPDGTYEDPISRMPVRQFDIPTVMGSIKLAFPDFQFQVAGTIKGADRMTAEWVLTGTNTQSLKPGIDPTGKKLHLRGVDVLEGEKNLKRATRYFDQKSMYEQIGMQVIVEPLRQGKAVYGYSKRVSSGNSSVPAIVGMTWIRFRDQSELDHIRTHSAQIIQDFLNEPGFISIVTGAAGDRAFTVTAWENELAMHRALDKAHSRAKHDFRTGDLSPGVWTSVWKPEHINRMWLRCPSCSQPNDASHDASECSNCGSPLPSRPEFW